MNTLKRKYPNHDNKTVALLSLFNAVELSSDSEEYSIRYSSFKKMISNGYIMDSRIIPTTSLINLVDELVGIGGEKLNSSFHKSWGTVSNALLFQLLIEQIFHYITTYGYESLGIYDENRVYIPAEKLDIPEVTEDIPLVFIKALTSEEILNEIVKIGSSGIALSKETISYIMDIVEASDYDYEFVEQIKNRELSVKLYEHFGIAPEEPVEWLRYVINKVAGESLLIKNAVLIGKIKQASANRRMLDALLPDAPKNLSSIFLRYKPLFLALKSISHNKTFFNRLRKDAVHTHKSVGLDYLSTITQQIKDGSFRIREFRSEMSRYSVWRKIRLAYALNNRITNESGSIAYKVRNGRSWVSDFNNPLSNKVRLQKVLDETLLLIANDISEKVRGNTYYIPEAIHYALPATEKQFFGNVPANSYVSIPDNVVVGVHWYNHNDVDDWSGRVDIDLSMVDVGGKYGWDGFYRNSDRSILYSGDVTTAPRPSGASELFYLRAGLQHAKTIFANYFNHTETPVALQFFVAREDIYKKLGKMPEQREFPNYMVNSANILFSQIVVLTEKQTNLGFLIGDGNETRIFLSASGVGNSITSNAGKQTTKLIDFQVATSVSPIELKTVLELAGATVVHSVSETQDYINLSPEALDKGSFIDLFSV